MTDLKKGDRVRFAHQARDAGADHTIADVGANTTTHVEFVELEGLPGQFAPHLFVRIPRP
jgi:hypothetical protein